MATYTYLLYSFNRSKYRKDLTNTNVDVQYPFLIINNTIGVRINVFTTGAPQERFSVSSPICDRSSSVIIMIIPNLNDDMKTMMKNEFSSG